MRTSVGARHRDLARRPSSRACSPNSCRRPGATPHWRLRRRASCTILALPARAWRMTGKRRPSFAAAIQASCVHCAITMRLLRDPACAVFWNFAFFALLAVWAPLAAGRSASIRRILRGAHPVDPTTPTDPGRAVGADLARRRRPSSRVIFGEAVYCGHRAAGLFWRHLFERLCYAPPADTSWWKPGPSLWLICPDHGAPAGDAAAVDQARIDTTMRTAIWRYAGRAGWRLSGLTARRPAWRAGARSR